MQHNVEVCPDDTAMLTERLDQLAKQGWEILTVCWQAKAAAEQEQSVALSAGGSFVIIARRQMEAILRRSDVADDMAIPLAG